MTNPGRLKAQRRPKRSASQMIVAGLLALAVVASLFLIFSESVQVLRVGLVIALWAAWLGAIAMTKYRRESALAKAKVNDLQTVYELQLEREISARREYELTVEKRIRSEVRADSEELAALRSELAALRKNLEVLFDGAIPTERTALRADATRVQELAGSYQPAASGLYIPGSGGNPSSSTGSRPPSQSTYGQSAYGQSAYGQGFASPYDDPVTAETSVVPADYDPNAMDTDRQDRQTQERSQQSSTYTVDGYPRDDAREAAVEQEAQMQQEAAPEQDVAVAAESHSDAQMQAVTAETSESETPESETDDDAPSGAHSSGLTVAQIMANMKAEQSTPSSSGGRRRRAE